MKNRNKYFIIIAFAILIKFFLFAFLVIYAPQNRFLPDSTDYLETAKVLSSRAAFAKISSDGSLRYETLRTPGYPVFLVFLQEAWKLPVNGVIFVQILLTLLTAFITYKAANRIDDRLTILSCAIVLYDPPVTIFSLIMLSETLFLSLMAVFMLAFVNYLRERKIGLIVFSALALVIATYTRPITYYLGALMALFIIYANIRAGGLKKAVIHALVFFVLVYGFLGVWQARNYRKYREFSFSSIIQQNYTSFGLFHSYPGHKKPGETPVAYYSSVTAKSFMSLMTRPGPFKYFRSQVLSGVGRVLAYPWMVFWVAGLIAGIARIRGNIYYQFLFCVILYFIAASIGGVSMLVGERFRVPMVPFIAIISAYGWLVLFKKVFQKQ